MSGLEGDAVFSYGLSEGFVDSQTFLETIEDTYVSFRRAIELMVLNNTCQCNACANVSSLDLKFFVHHGTFALQHVGGSPELMGGDVNLIHRLLKNSVTEETGIRAYMLCTDAALKRLELAEQSDGMISRVEEVDDFGEVRVWVRDMHPVYEARKDDQQVRFDPGEVVWELETEIAMTPELVWDYMNHTEYRNLLSSSDRFEVDQRGDRVGQGTVYVCYHGKRPVPQIVLEWRPFERMLTKQANPIPGPENYIHVDLHLTRTEYGTRLTSRGARPTGQGWQRWLANRLYPLMKGYFQRSLDSFRDAIETDHAARESSPGVELSTDLIRAAAETGLRPDESQ